MYIFKIYTKRKREKKLKKRKRKSAIHPTNEFVGFSHYICNKTTKQYVEN